MAWNSPKKKKKRGPAGDIPMEKGQEMEHWISNIMGSTVFYHIYMYIYIHYIYGDIDWQ